MMPDNVRNEGCKDQKIAILFTFSYEGKSSLKSDWFCRTTGTKYQVKDLLAKNAIKYVSNGYSVLFLSFWYIRSPHFIDFMPMEKLNKCLVVPCLKPKKLETKKPSCSEHWLRLWAVFLLLFLLLLLVMVVVFEDAQESSFTIHYFLFLFKSSTYWVLFLPGPIKPSYLFSLHWYHVQSSPPIEMFSICTSLYFYSLSWYLFIRTLYLSITIQHYISKLLRYFLIFYWASRHCIKFCVLVNINLFIVKVFFVLVVRAS